MKLAGDPLTIYLLFFIIINLFIYRYDYFFIVLRMRLTEDDLWLANQIKAIKKRFFFVRTKLDQDLHCNLLNYPDTYDEKKVMAEIYDDLEKQLFSNGFPNSEIFLISNKYQGKYDFAKLCQKISHLL